MNIYRERTLTPLTARQRQVYDFIADHVRRLGYPPTIRETAAHFSVGLHTIRCHLIPLEKKGAIAWTPRLSRGIRPLLPTQLGPPVLLPGALFFPVR